MQPQARIGLTFELNIVHVYTSTIAGAYESYVA